MDSHSSFPEVLRELLDEALRITLETTPLDSPQFMVTLARHYFEVVRVLGFGREPLLKRSLDYLRAKVQADERKLRHDYEISCGGAGCSGCCKGNVTVLGDEVHHIAVLLDAEAWSRVEEAAALPAEERLERVCPLLVDGLCSVYEQRPIRCRMHFTTQPTHHCGDLRFAPMKWVYAFTGLDVMVQAEVYNQAEDLLDALVRWRQRRGAR